MKKRIIAFTLALILLFTTLPLNAIALDNENGEETAATSVATEETSPPETEPATEEPSSENPASEEPETEAPPVEHRNPVQSNIGVSVQVSGGAVYKDGKWVWSTTSDADGHRFIFGINYSASGVGTVEAGDLQIRIPKTVLVARNGEPADEVEFSIPNEDEMDSYASEEELEQIDLVWREEDDCYLIYNYKPVSAAENGYIEIAFTTTKKPMLYQDMGSSNPFYAEYTVTIDGETHDSRSEDLFVYIDTQAKVTSTEKRYPVFFSTWNSSWGTAPDDAADFTYLVWEIKSNVDANQPYTFTLTDELMSSSNGGEEVVGYRMAGDTYFSDKNYATGQTTPGYRYDYVLTKQPKGGYEGLTTWSVKNKATATVAPADGVDASTSKSSQKEFIWKKPVFTVPTGSFKIFKRADGAFRQDPKDELLDAPGLTVGDYSRYDLNDFADGYLESFDGLDYSVRMKVYPFPWTIAEGSDPYDPASYGVVPVKVELIDEGVELHDDSDDMLALTSDDFQIDFITYTFTIKDAAFDETALKFVKTAPTYTDDDIISFYGKYGNSDEWVLIATRNLKTRTNWFDPTYVTSMNGIKVVLQDNCVAFKIETTNAHYYTEFCAVPSISLKNSAAVLEYIGEKESISVLNNAEGSFYKNDGSLIGSATEADSDFARRTKRDSSLEKQVVASTNVPRKKSFVITWRVKECELATFGEGTKEYIRQQSGIFYDLLPDGCILDPDTVSVQTDEGYLTETSYDVYQFPNYKDSGRTLLVVQVKVPAKYYNLYFDTIHPWESIKDHGTYVYNPVAYETGNDEIAQGYPDNGGAKDLADLFDWNDEDFFSDPEFTDYFTDLDTETDAPKFIYADESFDIQAITTAAAGLTKRVMGIGDTKYKYDTWTTINGDYQYRLRFMNTYTSITKDLILYDSIENYTTEGIESDWRGVLQSIDLTQLQEKGIAPVVYVSTVENLNLEGETNFIPNNDLTNEDVWAVWDGSSSLSAVKAIAIDMRQKVNGSTFILNPGESIIVNLFFKAPATADSVNTYPETYNNVYIKDTVVSLLGTEIPFFIHQDYTTVRFVVTANIPIKKVSAENENVVVPNIKFKLSGTSDYGNEVLSILTTDANGSIRFENIEKGSYILQEYETNDDWLFDGTEHRVVIDASGNVTIDGTQVTSAVPFVIANTPRIHGDVKLLKLPEDLSRDWTVTTEKPGEDDPPAPIDDVTDYVAQAQAEPSADFESGIPETTFKLSGISFYGNEVMVLETTNNVGRATFKNIEKGTYVLEEVIPNPNFVQNASKWIVVIDDSGNASVSEPDEEDQDRLYFVGQTGAGYTLENENRYWDLKLYKVDSFSPSIFLQGATFDLIGTSDFGTNYALTETTNEQGFLRFLHLEKGTYILRETTAPTGVDENGQLGGNRNYILDPNDHIVTISERGIVTIDGAVLTESGDLAMPNDRAMDGTITITKIWNDFVTDDADRPIPKLHLSTREIAANRNVYITVNWTGTDDTAETRPSFIKLYIGLADGTLVSDKTEVLNSPGNPTTVKMTALLDPNETYYVWADNARGYEALTSIENKAELQKNDDKTTGTVSFRKWPPTILVAGSTFNARIGRNLTSFTRAESMPNGVTTFLLSTPTSGLPVYAWKDGTDVSWYSDADTIYMNPDCSTMFLSCSKITYLDLENFDSSKVTNMKQMFSNCTSLRNLDVSGFDTSNVTSMWDMFYNYKGSSLDVSNFNVEKVTSFSGMFYGCSNLATIDVSNWNTKSATTFYQMFNGCSAVTVLDVSNWKTGNATDMRNMFSNCSSLSSVDVLNWDVGEVTSMSSMFQSSGITSINISGWNCGKVERMDYMLNNTKISVADVSNIDLSRLRSAIFMFAGTQITSIDLSDWNCPNLTTIEEMFTGCRQLQSINLNGMYAPKLSVIKKLFQWCGNLTEVNFVGATFGKITNMSGTFIECTRLQTINWANLDLSSLTNLSETFRNCSSLQYVDLSGMQTGNVTTMASLFEGCSKMTTLDVTGFDTGNVTRFSCTFKNCALLTELDVSTWNTSSATTMYQMFYGMKNLLALDLSSFNTSNVTNMGYMFDGAVSNITSLDLTSFDTSKVTTMDHMFRNMYNVQTLDLSSFDTSSVTNMNYMFEVCRKLQYIYASERWTTDAVTSDTHMFGANPLLPNWNASVIDKTNAHYNEGGYLTYKPASETSNPDDPGTAVAHPRGIYLIPVDEVATATNETTAIEDVYDNDLPMEGEDPEPDPEPEPDIASGTYYGVSWRVTSANELIIGQEGQTQSFSGSQRTDIWPWKSYSAQIQSIRFEGTVNGKGKHDSMFWGMKATSFDGNGFDTTEVTSLNTMFARSPFQTIDISTWDTGNVKNFSSMFGECSSLVTITGIENLDTSSATAMNGMFYYCPGLTYTMLDLSGWDVSNVTNFSGMFDRCKKVSALNLSGWNATVTSASKMFYQCTALTSIDLTDAHITINGPMDNMFYQCSSLTTIQADAFVTTNATSMESLFNGCAKFTTLDLSMWDTGKVTNMKGMLSNCTSMTSVNLTGFNTENVINFDSMFGNNSKLTTITGTQSFNTSKATNMSRMFTNCGSLNNLDVSSFNTEKVTTMLQMFFQCGNMTSLNLSSFDFSSCTTTAQMFTNDTKLATLQIRIDHAPNLTTMSQMFQRCLALTGLDTANWDVSHVTTLSNVFASCQKITALDLSGWDTSNASTMEGLFSGCSLLSDLVISSFNTSNVKNMKDMFLNCPKLYVLDVSHFDTSNVTTMYTMFAGDKFGRLDLSSWDTSKCTNMFRLFSGTQFDEVLNLGGTFTMSQATTLTEVFRRAIFQENAPSPNAYVFSNDINLKDTYFGGNPKYVHKTDGEGHRLYDQPALTMTQMSQLPKEEIAGKWVKAGYMSYNDLGDGDYEYISEDDEWYKNGNTWTYTFDVFDDTIQYYLTEEPMEGYTSEAMDTYIIVNANGEVTKMATIVNTAEIKTGALEVSKTVIGTATAQKFSFTISLAGPGITGTQIFSDTIFSNGTATIQLASGESRTFDGIPEGTTYSVTESTPSNYELQSYNTSGNITEGTTSSATFINTYIPPEREKVDITLAKRVEGQFELASNYHFVAQFNNLEANKAYETSSPNVSFTADSNGMAIVSLTLEAGESIQFIDIPVGATYVFTEEAGDYISAYELEDANGVSRFVSTSNENTAENVALSTALETSDEGEAVTVTFINTLKRTSNLILRKDVVSPLTEESSFEFTITLTNLPLGTKLNSTVGRFLADSDGNATKTVFLRAGESLEIEGVPVGAKYQISEAATKYIASYVVAEDDGSLAATAEEAANEIQNQPISTTALEVHEGKNIEVVFTNTFVRPGTITITKLSSAGQPMQNIPLRLEYSIDGGTTWQPIVSRNYPEDGMFPRGLSSTAGISDGILRTGSDGTATFTGLSVESTIQYRLLEVSTHNGKQLMKETIPIVPMPEVKTFETAEEMQSFLAEYNEKTTSNLDYEVDENALTVTLSHVYYEFINSAVTELPATGGRGFTALPVAVAVEVLTIAFLVENKKRKRKVKTKA